MNRERSYTKKGSHKWNGFDEWLHTKEYVGFVVAKTIDLSIWYIRTKRPTTWVMEIIVVS